MRPRVVNPAHSIFGQELARFKSLLDPFFALLRDFQNMSTFEFRRGYFQVFGEAANVVPINADITGHPAAQTGAFHAIKPFVTGHQGRRRTKLTGFTDITTSPFWFKTSSNG